jgi:hypothetical protein
VAWFSNRLAALAAFERLALGVECVLYGLERRRRPHTSGRIDGADPGLFDRAPSGAASDARLVNGFLRLAVLLPADSAQARDRDGRQRRDVEA